MVVVKKHSTGGSLMCSIAEVIRQFKEDWTRQFEDEAILAACRQAGVKWRDRLLTPVYVVKLFLLQILFGNTACEHVPRLAGKAFTGEAYCKARSRLPLAVLQTLLTTCTRAMIDAVRDDGRWLGHRLWLLDGTGFSMPDTPELRAHFGQPGGQKTGCGFPVAHGLALVHAATGLVQRLIIAPLRSHDIPLVAQVLEHFAPGDLAVGDRGFGSYAILAQFWQRGVFGLMPAHQRTTINFMPRRRHKQPGEKRARADRGLPYSRYVKRLGKQDQLVEWYRPKSCPAWLTAEAFAALPASLLVRELRFRIARKGCRVQEITLVTTLIDAERYSADALADLYLRRWNIETDFAHLKTTLRMDVLKCKSVANVYKEALMFVLVYNLVRMVIRAAARRQHIDIERISFIDAWRWIMSATPGKPLPKLVVNPKRPQRYEPRVRKRRPKQYPLMKRPRADLKQAFFNKGDAT
jgi:hypothetical protein